MVGWMLRIALVFRESVSQDKASYEKEPTHNLMKIAKVQRVNHHTKPLKNGDAVRTRRMSRLSTKEDLHT